MWYSAVIAAVICIGIFIWANKYYSAQRSKKERGEERPSFRTEGDLEEYGKPMKDGGSATTSDFDDAE